MQLITVCLNTNTNTTTLIDTVTVSDTIIPIPVPTGYYSYAPRFSPLQFMVAKGVVPTVNIPWLPNAVAPPTGNLSVEITRGFIVGNTVTGVSSIGGKPTSANSYFIICEHVRPLTTLNYTLDSVLGTISGVTVHPNGSASYVPAINQIFNALGNSTTTAASISQMTAANASGVVHDAYAIIYNTPWKVVVVDRWSGYTNLLTPSLSTTQVINVEYIYIYNILNIRAPIKYIRTTKDGITSDITGIDALTTDMGITNTFNMTTYTAPLVFSDSTHSGYVISASTYAQTTAVSPTTSNKIPPSFIKLLSPSVFMKPDKDLLLATGICTLNTNYTWAYYPMNTPLQTQGPKGSPPSTRTYLDLVGSDGVTNAFTSSYNDMIGYIDWQLSSFANVDLTTSGTAYQQALPPGPYANIAASQNGIQPPATKMGGAYWDDCIYFHNNIYSPIHSLEKSVNSVRRIRVVISNETGYGINYMSVATSNSPNFSDRYGFVKALSNIMSAPVTLSTGAVMNPTYNYPRIECHFSVWPASERGSQAQVYLTSSLSPVPANQPTVPVVDIRTSFYSDSFMMDEYAMTTYMINFAGYPLHIIQTPHYINLMPTQRLCIRCPELEPLINFGNAGTASQGIAMFPVSATTKVFSTSDTGGILLAGGKNFQPISYLDRLTLTIQADTGDVVDMRGLDYYIVIKLTSLVPDVNLLYKSEFEACIDNDKGVPDDLLDSVYDVRKKAIKTSGRYIQKVVEKTLHNKFEDAIDLVFNNVCNNGAPKKELPVLTSQNVVSRFKPLPTQDETLSYNIPQPGSVAPPQPNIQPKQ